MPHPLEICYPTSDLKFTSPPPLITHHLSMWHTISDQISLVTSRIITIYSNSSSGYKFTFGNMYCNTILLTQRNLNDLLFSISTFTKTQTMTFSFERSSFFQVTIEVLRCEAYNLFKFDLWCVCEFYFNKTYYKSNVYIKCITYTILSVFFHT